MDSDRPNPHARQSLAAKIVFWSSILCLFLIVHLTQNRISAGFAGVTGRLPEAGSADWTEFLIASIPTLKALFFVLALGGLTHGLISEVLQSLKALTRRQILSTLILAAMIALILGALVVPTGNVSMGEGYALCSQDPFSQSSDWYHKRLLMPAMAYLLLFRGEAPYLVFGFFLTVIFIALLNTWLSQQAPLTRLQLFSLCTSSFVIHQFQAPGYPDVLVFCFLLGVLFGNLSHRSKLTLLVLALLTHEASLFIGLPLALRYLDRCHRLAYLAALSIYGFLWLACSRFHLEALLGSHDVEGISGIGWVLDHPWLEAAGIFFAFKALWLLPAIAVIVGIKQNKTKDVGFIIVCVASGVILTLVGVDCSRMAGYAFPAILVSMKMISSLPMSRVAQRAFIGLLILNLLIPSLSVGLNVGINSGPGLYREVLRLVAWR